MTQKPLPSTLQGMHLTCENTSWSKATLLTGERKRLESLNIKEDLGLGGSDTVEITQGWERGLTHSMSYPAGQLPKVFDTKQRKT